MVARIGTKRDQDRLLAILEVWANGDTSCVVGGAVEFGLIRNFRAY